MNWKQLTTLDQLDQIDEESKTKMVLIYKHSTRCGICDTVKEKLEGAWKDELEKDLSPYYLDLLANRRTSNEIADRYNVRHQSPQVLVISNGKCIYSESQMTIKLKDILNEVKGTTL